MLIDSQSTSQRQRFSKGEHGFAQKTTSRNSGILLEWRFSVCNYEDFIYST